MESYVEIFIVLIKNITFFFFLWRHCIAFLLVYLLFDFMCWNSFVVAQEASVMFTCGWKYSFVLCSSMVKLSVAKKWGFKEFKYLCEDASDSSRVTKIKCQVCCEFYGEKPEQLEKLQGQVKTFVKRWVQGSEVIKKKQCSRPS